MAKSGKVYIIGAGPGDYKLITLKAVECIGRADVIVYDRLINEKILGLAKESAELVYVGKMPDCHIVPQESINEILVKKALEGKTVARVKGGDPFVFGRGGEEAQSLVERGIEFEIIPGITSAVAVPAYAGIPVTHRDCCSSLHIITGHERPDKDNSMIDYDVLAKVEGTLVFLMGVKNLPDISSNLIRCGKEKLTPAAVIEKGTTTDQRTVTGTLENISDRVSEAGIKSPAVIVVGEVVRLEQRLNWFSKGTLAGKRIIVTRSREQASKLVEKIEEHGGEAIELPTIKIAEPEDYTPFDRALESLKDYNWIAFTSVNGVKAFFKRLRVKAIDIRELSGIKLCAVGEATAEELNMHGLNVDYIPKQYTTGALLDGLIKIAKPREKVLLARADIANKELAKGLRDKGIAFDEVTVYRTLINTINRDETLRLLDEGEIDFITFTSSSTVKNFITIIGEENLGKISKLKVLCIGPVTAKAAMDSGIHITASAQEYTIDGLVKKLLECCDED